jgi:hypothetical protein
LFAQSHEDAVRIMVMDLARQHQHPLQCIIEKDGMEYPRLRPSAPAPGSGEASLRRPGSSEQNGANREAEES